VVASLVATATALAAPGITLTGPSSITAGTSASFGGSLTGFGSPKTVSLSQFAGGSCAGTATAAGSGSASLASGWLYSIAYTAGSALANTTISLQSSTVSAGPGGRTISSNCLSVNVLGAGGHHHAVVVLPSHAFLCYSKSQGAPTTSDSWTADAAAGLITQGYWQPYAVAGNDSSSDAVNVGSFHLACNPATAQSAGGPNGYVDNDGSQVPSDLASLIGVYAIAG
jgi:hypothetical protein